MYQGFLLIAVELWVTWVDQFVMVAINVVVVDT